MSNIKCKSCFHKPKNNFNPLVDKYCLSCKYMYDDNYKEIPKEGINRIFTVIDNSEEWTEECLSLQEAFKLLQSHHPQAHLVVKVKELKEDECDYIIDFISLNYMANDFNSEDQFSESAVIKERLVKPSF